MAGLTKTQKPSERVFGNKAVANTCKSDSQFAGTSPLCPQCRSAKVWRDALRYTDFGDKIQRWLCRECGFRFSDPNDVKNAWGSREKAAKFSSANEIKACNDTLYTSQICVTETKNLAAEQQKTEVLRRNETSTANGKIIEYEFWMLKQRIRKEHHRMPNKNYETPHKTRSLHLRSRVNKRNHSKTTMERGRKEIVVEAYTNFLIMAGGKWDPPRYHRIEKIPFIPTEQEIDQLIAGCGEKSYRSFNHSKKQECE